VKHHPKIEKVLISDKLILEKIAEMGQQISKDYEGKTPTFVGILKGGVMFMSDLLKFVSVDCKIDFICPSSYDGIKSTGVVRLLLDLKDSIEGKDVVLVEDIVDSGLTMNYLLENLKTRRPRSVEICTLLSKPSCRKIPVPIKYVGFEIPNEFVIGYGMDFNELYRNLKYIGVMKHAAN
jgi:hypoxanthine phosphoribosyltransferase